MGGGSSSARVRKVTDSSECLDDGAASEEFASLQGMGVIIPDAEARGISLDQMRTLFAFVTTKSKEEMWQRPESGNPPTLAEANKFARSQSFSDKGSNPTGRLPKLMYGLRQANRKKKLLTADDVDLYTIVQYVVQPATLLRNCSYVEFIASDAASQTPLWFVSHWWGEKFYRFLNCLELFSSRHDLTNDTPFWVCAYAIRQNTLSSEIGTGDPMDEPFAKAIASDKVHGTVAILDENLVTYKRAWCCFEATITLCLQKRLDLVISRPSGTFMIADGQSVPRGDRTVAVQEARDQQFPLEVAEEGMRVAIELSTTSIATDKNRILNCIALENVSLDAPPLYHRKYDHYNDKLRSKFAAMFLRIVTINGDADAVKRALYASPSSVLVWRNAQGQTQLEVARALADGDPDDSARRDIVAFMEQAALKVCESIREPPSPKMLLSPPSVVSCRFNSRPSSPDSVCSSHSSLSRFVARSLGESIHRNPSTTASSLCPDEIDSARQTSRSRTIQITSSSERPLGFAIEPVHDSSLALPSQKTIAKRRKSVPVFPGVPLSSLTEEAETSTPVSALASKSEFPKLDAVVATSEKNFPMLPALSHSMFLPMHMRPRPVPDRRGRISPVTTLSDDTDDSGCSSARPDHGHGIVVDGRVDVSLVTNLLCSPTGHLALHENCCRALGALASIGVEFQDAVMSAGGLDAIITAMRTHSDNAGFQTEACLALFHIIFDNERNVQVAKVGGVAHAVKSAMRKHEDNMCLRKEGRRVLGELAMSAAT